MPATGFTLGTSEGATLGTQDGATVGELVKYVSATGSGAGTGTAILEGTALSQPSGFTLGGRDGATLGGSSGGTLGAFATQTGLSATGTGTGSGTSRLSATLASTASGTGTGVGSGSLLDDGAMSAYGTGVGSGSGFIDRVRDLSASGTSVGAGSARISVGGDLIAAGVGVGGGVASLTAYNPDYRIGGVVVPRYTSEVATPESLELEFRVENQTLLDALRPLKQNEGQVALLQSDDGGFSSVDRANGGNTFSVEPASPREPLRVGGDYHVRRYEEDLVSQAVEEWAVSVEFVRSMDRVDSKQIEVSDQIGTSGVSGRGGTLGGSGGFTLGGSGGATLSNSGSGVPSDHWGIETRYGTIVTDRVDADFLGTGREGVERFELVMRLEFDQAHSFETALSRLRGARVRRVPDGDNVVVDDTSDGAASVTIDSPRDRVVPSGGYVVRGWESRRLNDRFQEVRVEVVAED